MPARLPACIVVCVCARGCLRKRSTSHVCALHACMGCISHHRRKTGRAKAEHPSGCPSAHMPHPAPGSEAPAFNRIIRTLPFRHASSCMHQHKHLHTRTPHHTRLDTQTKCAPIESETHTGTAHKLKQQLGLQRFREKHT